MAQFAIIALHFVRSGQYGFLVSAGSVAVAAPSFAKKIVRMPLGVGSLCGTGHSNERMPRTALAEDQPLAVTGTNDRSQRFPRRATLFISVLQVA